MLHDDQLYKFDDLNILIHKNDNVYFDHTKLDFVYDVFGKGKFQVLKM